MASATWCGTGTAPCSTTTPRWWRPSTTPSGCCACARSTPTPTAATTPGRPSEPGEWRALDEAYHVSYGAWVERLKLAPDAEAALAAAEAAGLTQSLLSMWRHQDLVPLVERLGIGRFFVRVDGLRVPGGGAKTEHLVEHLAALGVEATAALLVGDALDDLAAARAVGAGCVLYDGGSHHRHALEATGVPVVDTLTAAVEAAAGPAAGRRPGTARHRPAR